MVSATLMDKRKRTETKKAKNQKGFVVCHTTCGGNLLFSTDFKNCHSWASLVAQCKEAACRCRRHGSDPWSVEQLSPCTTTIKSVLYSLGAATSEAHAPRGRALQPEKLLQWEAQALQLEKSPHSSEDPAQTKTNKLIKLLKHDHSWILPKWGSYILYENIYSREGELFKTYFTLYFNYRQLRNTHAFIKTYFCLYY